MVSSSDSETTTDDSEANESEEDDSGIRFDNLHMIRRNTRPVVEIPCRKLSKPAIEVEMVDADIAASSDAEYTTTRLGSKAIEPPVILEEKNTSTKIMSTDEVKRFGLIESTVASGSSEKGVLDDQSQALDSSLELIRNLVEINEGTADMNTHSEEGSYSNLSTDACLLGMPVVTVEVSQATCMKKDEIAARRDFATRIVNSCSSEKQESSPTSMEKNTSEDVANPVTLIAPTASKFVSGSKVSMDGETKRDEPVLLKVLSSVAETSNREYTCASEVQPRKMGSKDSSFEVLSRTWEASVPNNTSSHISSIFAVESRNRASLQTNYHRSISGNIGSSSGSLATHSTNQSIPPAHHYQKSTNNTSAVDMAKILKLAEDKPKIKSRFKPRVPNRITERRLQGLTSGSKITSFASRPNLTPLVAERAYLPSHLQKRSPGSPAGGESSMKKFRAQDSSLQKQH